MTDVDVAQPDGSNEELLISDAVMRHWLNGALSGCRFAKSLAGPKSQAIHYRTVSAKLDGQLGAALTATLRDSASQPATVVFTFPDFSSPLDIANLARALAVDSRWRFDEVRRGSGPDLLLRMTWTTDYSYDGRPLSMCALGLAPLGTMPVTRRSPYVGLVLWPGSHLNPYRQPKEFRDVSLIDMPTEAMWPTRKAHGKTWDDTEKLTKDMRDTHQASALGAAHDVSFALDPSVRSVLFG